MIAIGSKVNTNRRKGIIVTKILSRGWLEGRTLAGKIISFSSTDVTESWEPCGIVSCARWFRDHAKDECK